jgi:uncharacterized protein (TIGR02453 family)
MKDVFDFLKKLKKNNSKEWFDAHRSEYEGAKKQVITLVEAIIPLVEKIDPEVQNLQAKDCMFRINRDVRFSKNKDPYKTNMGIVFAPGGKKSTKGCYYLHIEPGHCFIAGGIWMPMPEDLKKIRQEIDYNGDALEKLLKAKSFKKYFTSFDQEAVLTKVPKGYDATHPHADLLKLKSFTVSFPIEDSVFLEKKPEAKIVKVFAEIVPVNQFLNTAID